MQFQMNDPELKKLAETVASAHASSPKQWHLTDFHVLKVILADGRAILYTKGDPLPNTKPEPKTKAPAPASPKRAGATKNAGHGTDDEKDAVKRVARAEEKREGGRFA